MNEVTIKAELLMMLENKQEWINYIPKRLPAKNRHKEQFLWVDANGCVFEIGADFAAAERMATYPCRIYRTITVAQFEALNKDADNG